MAKLDARSIVIILASFGLVAGTLILVQKRNGPPEAPPASGSQALAAPPSAPLELLDSGPIPAPAPAPVAAPTPHSASVVSAPQHAIPAGSPVPTPAPASAARPIVVASSAKPASMAVPAPAGTAKHHAIPAESEPAPAPVPKASVAKPVATASTTKPASVAATPVKPVPAPVKPVAAPVKVATAGRYFLQAGAFKDEGNARRLIARLKSSGYTATESTVGELHKVLVGPYPSADAAAAAKAKLKALGIDTAFVAKS